METEGELDLRGFLGIDKNVTPGYSELKYKVHLRGNGTREQYEEIHRTVAFDKRDRLSNGLTDQALPSAVRMLRRAQGVYGG